jgi:hypothetical protein
VRSVDGSGSVTSDDILRGSDVGGNKLSTTFVELVAPIATFGAESATRFDADVIGSEDSLRFFSNCDKFRSDSIVGTDIFNSLQSVENAVLSS